MFSLIANYIADSLADVSRAHETAVFIIDLNEEVEGDKCVRMSEGLWNDISLMPNESIALKMLTEN
jgi:hypothetical protein